MHACSGGRRAGCSREDVGLMDQAPLTRCACIDAHVRMHTRHKNLSISQESMAALAGAAGDGPRGAGLHEVPREECVAACSEPSVRGLNEYDQSHAKMFICCVSAFG